MKTIKKCPDCGKSICNALKGWACRNPPLPTFAAWYEKETGISLEEAKRQRVIDLGILERAWNFPN